jgi:hypothetical protein
MATTTTYGWTTPDNSGLVKNGAQDIRSIGQSIDTFLNRPFSRNLVLNSSMNIWQRGTSITTGGAYTADRWYCGGNTAATVTRQVTNDTTNLPFIQYCARVQRNSGSALTNNINFLQPFETLNSIPLAGRTVTFSFYARAGANYSSASNALRAIVNTGTGTDQNAYLGYTGSASPIDQTATLTTTWQRFSYSATVATNVTELAPYFLNTPVGTAGANDWYEVTGVQLEIGNQASPYISSTPTYQSELAACQRYYFRWNAVDLFSPFGQGISTSSTNAQIFLQTPVQMRTKPTILDFSTLVISDIASYNLAISAMSISSASSGVVELGCSNSAGATANRGAFIRSNNSTNGFLGLGAEL